MYSRYSCITITVKQQLGLVMGVGQWLGMAFVMDNPRNMDENWG